MSSSSSVRRAYAGGVLVAGALAACALLPAGAGAATADATPARFTACITTTFGTMNLVTGRDECAAGQRAITWNARGPRGARGVRGVRGVRGPVGRVGAQGPAGAIGPVGPAGAQGPAGAPGAAGPAGPQGETGAVGPHGPQGPTGPQGATGTAGETGPQGATGPVGATGAAGPTGPTGAQGPAGDPGTLAADAGHVYQLATIADATVVGGADVPFSNNGSLGSGVIHTAGTTTTTVSAAGRYRVGFTVNFTAGVGAQYTIAVNGSATPAFNTPALTATGQVSGEGIIALTAGDVITLRNNSAVPGTLALAPSVGASLVVERIS